MVKSIYIFLAITTSTCTVLLHLASHPPRIIHCSHPTPNPNEQSLQDPCAQIEGNRKKI
ncbi:hypothetical protein BDV09DRAFT_173682 [Aspergillus tetrazonus]